LSSIFDYYTRKILPGLSGFFREHKDYSLGHAYF
jgi:hypothetical protein